MASVENIVKVMNFHSLIRVDKAKREADKFLNVEDELNKILYQIVNNQNLKLDKKILLENPKGIVLNIYIGNDLGFCGNFNHQLQKAIQEDKEALKIVIGKKLFHLEDENIILKIEKDNFQNEYEKIDEIINVVYNHYYNVNEIIFERKKLFPVEITTDNIEDINLNIDYVIETDVNHLITSVLALCICYQIRIFESNSLASENIMREKITSESIKKIEEIEEEQEKEERKRKKQEEFKKDINNHKNIER